MTGTFKGGRSYHPQQSVLNPHSGQRHTACIRYISALPQRSQIMRSSGSADFGLATNPSAVWGGGDDGHSGMGGIIANVEKDTPGAGKKLHSVRLLAINNRSVLIVNADVVQ